MHPANASTSPDKRIIEALRLAAEAPSNPGDNNIFRELALNITRALEVAHAFVGELHAGMETEVVHVIGGYFNGQCNDGFDYSLDGTPCRNVVGQCYRYYSNNVQALFPDLHLREVGAIGYAAIPLFASTGRPIGIMAILDTKPLTQPELTESLLKIFAVRAALELEQRYVLAAKQRSDANFKVLFEATDDAVFIHDLHSGAILDVNPRATEIYGHTREQFRELSIGQLSAGYPPYTETEALRYIEQARQGKPTRFEWRSRNRDGTLRWEEVKLKRFTRGDTDRIIAFTRDITERKEHEEAMRKSEDQMRQAQKMEAIGHLTGGIAHDFNNILTTILGYTAMAREKVDGAPDNALAKYLDHVQTAGQKAQNLIQQMLTFSRGQHGHPRALDLADLIPEVVALIRGTFPSTIELSTRIPGNCAQILVDPIQTEQVLLNLCINARDAMPAGGRLTIAVAQTRHPDDLHCRSCHQPVNGTWVGIEVSDQGEGIPESVLERIFEPFFTTKKSGHGSGMGLAMVHGIVHDHGGHILVDSSPGSGTRFRILLPPVKSGVSKPQSSGDQSTASTPVSHHALAGRVLVVDDEPMVAEYMGDLLKGWGLDTTITSSGAEALEQITSPTQSFNLVITDQTMPRMTGLQLCQQLQHTHPNLPVVLYTGFSEQLTETEASEAGAVGLLRKPVELTTLYELLARHLSNR
ncbi:ATP-binding protein [Marinobacter sp. ATCH36]|uniref:hybrid sensor histidine kinase/response regulator n=1 Tax=Marinobacter sp. ATCH36 TaxID=2945106 RepID=UPI00202068CB|nr:ATP-binding protein [Marinobacter sp. ATCH36]MCL7943524.1 response regulator [Marinobacter sp. ATCH36]